MSADPSIRTTERCESCKFYRPNPSGVIGASEDDGGDCRREPPKIIANVSAQSWGLFPAVEPDSWCGEWKSRRQD